MSQLHGSDRPLAPYKSGMISPSATLPHRCDVITRKIYQEFKEYVITYLHVLCIIRKMTRTCLETIFDICIETRAS